MCFQDKTPPSPVFERATFSRSRAGLIGAPRWHCARTAKRNATLFSSIRTRISAATLMLLVLAMVGCAGGTDVGGRPPNGLSITHLHGNLVAKHADAVHIRVFGPSREKLIERLDMPFRERYDLPESAPGGRVLEITYLNLGAVIGEAIVDVDLSDGGENVSIAGSPVGPHDLISNDRGWSVTSKSAPAILKGVGFDYTWLDQSADGRWFAYVDPVIANLGANAVRTYGLPWTDGGAATPGSPAYQAEDISKLLAFAAQHNVFVLVGIFVDGSATDARVSDFANLVQADPNFGNVLGWCVGNEVGQNLFSTVEQLAKHLKAGMKQPAHVRPVSTALPSVATGFVRTLQQAMPSLDLIGINTFYGCFDSAHCGGGFLNTQADSLVAGGWKKPWMITEYYSYDLQSPQMPNQMLNGGNRYMLELNSTLNSKNYANSYSNFVSSARALKSGSIGGFMLNFGPPHNSKLVASWLEPFTYTGAFTPYVNPPWNNGANKFLRLEAVDAVAALYGGNLASDCPQIVLDPADNDPQGVSCSFKATLSSPGTKLTASQSDVTASVMAKSGGPAFTWYLVGGQSSAGPSGNIAAFGTNPQAYEQPTTVLLGPGTPSDAGGGVTRNTIKFTVPDAPGNNYQLRVIVTDSSTDGAATAAIGFAVR